LHEEDISIATTFSILNKGLVSHCDIPFQIYKYSEKYFQYLKRIHPEKKPRNMKIFEMFPFSYLIKNMVTETMMTLAPFSWLGDVDGI